MIKSVTLMLFTFTISSCVLDFSQVERAKRDEIRKAYYGWVEEYEYAPSKYIHHSIKRCRGICDDSETSSYYIDLHTNACDGHISIEETCEDGTCTYIFDEIFLMVCS
ncbi:MAG: hypothetical protein ACI85E_000205 [Marinomonas primoryensis]|jgi:hypothetical protein